MSIVGRSQEKPVPYLHLEYPKFFYRADYAEQQRAYAGGQKPDGSPADPALFPEQAKRDGLTCLVDGPEAAEALGSEWASSPAGPFVEPAPTVVEDETPDPD